METKYKEKIGLGEKIAYMLGGMGGVPLFAIISSFLVYFYTNVIGLNPGIVGGIILISKIFDGISDLILGNIIDKTRSMGASDCVFWRNWNSGIIYCAAGRNNRSTHLCVFEL